MKIIFVKLIDRRVFGEEAGGGVSRVGACDGENVVMCL